MDHMCEGSYWGVMGEGLRHLASRYSAWGGGKGGSGSQSACKVGGGVFRWEGSMWTTRQRFRAIGTAAGAPPRLERH